MWTKEKKRGGKKETENNEGKRFINMEEKEKEFHK